LKESGFAECKELALKMDKRELRLAVTYRTYVESSRRNEVARVELDDEMLSAIGAAKQVQLQLCDLGWTLTQDQVSPGQVLHERYRTRISKIDRGRKAPALSPPASDTVQSAAPQNGS
jgi:hypothetical protein